MNQSKSVYIEKVTDVIKAYELDRMFGGVLSDADFVTSYPNKNRIKKIYSGIANYLHYRRCGNRREDDIDDDGENIWSGGWNKWTNNTW